MTQVSEPLSWDLPEDRGLKWVWYISIFCMIVSILLTLKEYVLHKRFENHPKVQHYMQRLLLTMPVYGICGAGSIVFPNCTVQFILIRQSFQAYMVYNFVELLIAYFTPYATEQVRIKNLEALCKKMDKVKAKPPCCCMGTLHPGTHWLHDQVLVPVRVFAVAIPLLAVIGLLFDAYNNYGFGVQDPDRAWFWLNLLSVLCTIWALSGLFTVFQVLQPLLQPFAKLQNTCVHIVLGPMVLQEFLIGILAESGSIGEHFGLATEQASALHILNLMFCIESVLVGWLFTKAFSAAPFYEKTAKDKKFLVDNHSAIKQVEAEHGHHFALGHKMPSLTDAARVQFTDAGAVADINSRSRRESTANDHSRLSVRHHEAKGSAV